MINNVFDLATRLAKKLEGKVRLVGDSQNK